jgi:proteasome alpha subunit
MTGSRRRRKSTEFEELRIAGIPGDLRGYQYGREDVKARDLANAYSQAPSTILTQQMKPYEVEVLVGEVDGEGPLARIYHHTRRSVSDGTARRDRGSPDLMVRARGYAAWDLATSIRTARPGARHHAGAARSAEQIEGAVLTDEDPAAEFRRLAPTRSSRPCPSRLPARSRPAGIPWGPRIGASSASRTARRDLYRGQRG